MTKRDGQGGYTSSLEVKMAHYVCLEKRGVQVQVLLVPLKSSK